MFEVIGAIGATTAYALLIGVLVGFSPADARIKFTALMAAMLWGSLIVVLAASGAFSPDTTGPIPGPILAFAALMVLLFGSWFMWPGFRSSLLSVPIWALVGLHIARIGGVFFLILTTAGRLSAPFGPSAGWGDIIVGVIAIPLAVLAAIGLVYPAVIRIWNALGVLDLIVAISLGALSSPGTPFRVFTEGPGTLAMTTLPWIMIPAMLVPFYLLVHATIEVKLRELRAHRVEARRAA